MYARVLFYDTFRREYTDHIIVRWMFYVAAFGTDGILSQPFYKNARTAYAADHTILRPIKCVVGLAMVRSGIWARNIVK